MENRGHTILYSDAEVAEFYPIWETIAKIGNFRAETERMRDIMLLADEESIMNGSSPLIPDIRKYEQKLEQLVTTLSLGWPEDKIKVFRFYCLYHEDRSKNFDVRSAERRAQEALMR